MKRQSNQPKDPASSPIERPFPFGATAEDAMRYEVSSWNKPIQSIDSLQFQIPRAEPAVPSNDFRVNPAT